MLLVDLELGVRAARVSIAHAGEVAEANQLDCIVKITISRGDRWLRTKPRYVVVESIDVGCILVEEEAYGLVSPIW